MLPEHKKQKILMHPGRICLFIFIPIIPIPILHLYKIMVKNSIAQYGFQHCFIHPPDQIQATPYIEFLKNHMARSDFYPRIKFQSPGGVR